mgnify:CR=1 FL=1
MFSFVTLGTNNLKKSKHFYSKLLFSLGIVVAEDEDRYVGYAKKNKQNIVEFYLMKPHNNEAATFGNGTMITFTADSKEDVINTYKLALKLGGKDEGSPGPRHKEHFYAYFRDLDGNKICIYCPN